MRVSYNGEYLRVVAPYGFHETRIAQLINCNQAKVCKIVAEAQKKVQVVQTTQPRKHYEKHKEAAREYIEEKVRYFNNYYRLRHGRISIRNQKTRWGSCSTKKNLNFNYKILFLPEHLADYVVVHELCHLLEPNHSKAFWYLVSKRLPDYKERHKELQKYRIT
jgi:predicted metal-dependent hydrolase